MKNIGNLENKILRENFYNVEMLCKIENALDLDLYEWQIKYLLGSGGMQSGRASGKSVVYWIDVFLFDREPLDLSIVPFTQQDEYRYAKSIYDKLKAGGLNVREVKFPMRFDYE